MGRRVALRHPASPSACCGGGRSRVISGPAAAEGGGGPRLARPSIGGGGQLRAGRGRQRGHRSTAAALAGGGGRQPRQPAVGGGGRRSATASLAVYWRWAAFCWPRAVTASLFDCCCLDGRRRATWRPHRSLCPRPSRSRSRPPPTHRP